MPYREVTIALVGLCAIVLIAWDLFVLLANDEEGDTISEVLSKSGNRFWTLPYAFGVIGGHLWMPGSPLPVATWWSVLLLVVLGVLAGVVGFFAGRLPQPKLRIAGRAFGLLNLGLVAGALLWPI